MNFDDHPESIGRSIHSTNHIELIDRKARKIKIVDFHSAEGNGVKIIYLRVAEINEKWSFR